MGFLFFVIGWVLNVDLDFGGFLFWGRFGFSQTVSLFPVLSYTTTTTTTTTLLAAVALSVSVDRKPGYPPTHLRVSLL